MDDTATCTGCGETKALQEFGVEKRNRNGHRWRCKQCTNAYTRAYKRAKRIERAAKEGRVYKPRPYARPKGPRSPEERLQIYSVPGNGGCIVWTGARLPSGYGRITVDNEPHYVHRLAWEIANGSIADGHCIDHLCGNRACINPEHMQVVTLAMNTHRGNLYYHYGADAVPPYAPYRPNETPRGVITKMEKVSAGVAAAERKRAERATYMNLEEVGIKLGVTRERVRQVATKHGIGVRVGHRWRFSNADLELLVQSKGKRGVVKVQQEA